MEVDERFVEENGLGVQFEIVAGNKVKNVENPGKLVVELKEKFLFNRKIGNHLHYHCAKKESLKCAMKAKLIDNFEILIFFLKFWKNLEILKKN